MRTFASLLDFSQSALFFYLSSQFLILHLLISVCTHFHHLFLVVFFSRLPWGLLLNTSLNFLLLTILLTWPVQFSWHLLTIESTRISESPNVCINYLFYRFRQILFTLILPKYLLKPKMSKQPNINSVSIQIWISQSSSMTYTSGNSYWFRFFCGILILAGHMIGWISEQLAIFVENILNNVLKLRKLYRV